MIIIQYIASSENVALIKLLYLPSGLLVLLPIEIIQALLIQSSGLILYIITWFREHIQSYLATWQFMV